LFFERKISSAKRWYEIEFYKFIYDVYLIHVYMKLTEEK